MDAVSVWVEHLREQAVEAQCEADRAARFARSQLGGWRAALVSGAQLNAWRLGIIAREARRQYQSAVAAVRQSKLIAPAVEAMCGVAGAPGDGAALARAIDLCAPFGPAEAVAYSGLLMLVGHEP